MDSRAIGVMDSGLGGLTAVRALLRLMPNENVIYFGDTGRVPYGTRSKETIIKYAKQDIAFLRSFDIKAIIVACGTVSSVALELISGQYDIPIIGVVRSAAKQAASVTKNQKIGVIATPGTVASGAYKRVLCEYLPEAEVTETACPLFVPLVENGRFQKGDIVIETIAREYLQPLKASGIDTLILGCTHYPLLREIIADVMGENVFLVDSGAQSVIYAKEILDATGKTTQTAARGTVRYYVSDSADSFVKHAAVFLGEDAVPGAQQIDIEQFAFEENR